MNYIDIRILAGSDEFGGASVVWSALMQAVHGALSSTGCSTVGVVFPQYGKQDLGQILRLVGPQQDLKDVVSAMRIARLSDSVRVSEVGVVPPQASWVTVRRVQRKTSTERERRRFAKRFPDKDPVAAVPVEARDAYPETPFVVLRSASTGQAAYRLHVQQQDSSGEVSGQFNAFGLSAQATLPQF